MKPEQIIEETPRFISCLKDAFSGEGWGKDHRECIALAHDILIIVDQCAKKHVEFKEGNITREQFDKFIDTIEDEESIGKNFLSKACRE